MRTEEIITYRRVDISIYQEEYQLEDPNDWYDDRFLIFDHRDLYVTKEGFDPKAIFEDGEKSKGFHVFRCYAYIHGGVVLAVKSHSFPDAQWDVSFKGFWLVKRTKGTWTQEQALKAAREFCKSWNEYLSGDIWGYSHQYGGCGGFYGKEGRKQMIAEAKEEIDHELAQLQLKINFKS